MVKTYKTFYKSENNGIPTKMTALIFSKKSECFEKYLHPEAHCMTKSKAHIIANLQRKEPQISQNGFSCQTKITREESFHVL